MTSTPQAKAANKKSGLRVFKPGEIIFNEGDNAESLFIIQRGQIRLFRPKGRGFVEIGVLRAGEVIGEMAYFDEKSRRRSCSASAMVSSEMIEISFAAFEKTLQGLNPWFKTIINTLADRLRKTNERVKELESNSIGYGSGGKVSDYKFFQGVDVARILSLLYMALKTHGQEKDGGLQVHLNVLKFYTNDIFNVQDVKFEEFLELLKRNGFVEMREDDDGVLKMIHSANPEQLKFVMGFLNTQRRADDSKRMRISYKCEIFLEKILTQLTSKGASGKEVKCDISTIQEEFNRANNGITGDDLNDAIEQKFCQELVVHEGNQVTCLVNYDLLNKMYPAIHLMNEIERANETKTR